MNPTYIVLASACAVAAGILAVWVMTRLKLPVAWIRKLSHLGSMTLIIAIAFLVGYKLFVVAGAVFAAMLLLIKLIRPPAALKTEEAKQSFGEVYFFIGVAITAVIATSVGQFVVPIAILGLADTAAYIVGRSVTSPKLIFSKTLAGSLAFVAVAFLLLLLVTSWPVALIGAAITAIAEMVGLRGSDNITIPVVAVLILVIN